MAQSNDIEARVERLETLCMDLSTRLGNIEGSTNTIKMLLQWVVLPLIVIVGGLVGIKLVFPGS